MEASSGITKTALVDAAVVVTINDPDVIDRVTGPGGDEWRSQIYNLRTEEDVIGHLAYNAVVNGVERVNRLDGWADLRDDAAVMSISMVDCVEVRDVD